jgi:hypothetical protein
MRKCTSEKTVEDGKLGTVCITTGSEGPEHDPYSFTEYSFKYRGMDFMLHLGLGETLKIDETEVRGYDKIKLVWNGIMQEDVDKFFSRMVVEFTVCPACGADALEWQEGFPGESLLMCQKCHGVCDSSFNESAIM